MLRSRAQIEETTSDFDREKLQERLAKLAGGVAVVRVGAATETEMKEAKLRMEDALECNKSSCRRRYYCRWWICIYSCIKRRLQIWQTNLEGDEKTGAKIILESTGSSAYNRLHTMQVWKVLLLSTK